VIIIFDIMDLVYSACSVNNNMKFPIKYGIFVILASLLILPILLTNNVQAALVPDWVKQTAKWFGDDMITEDEFLNAIKFLINNGILVLDESPSEEILKEDSGTPLRSEIVIPNGNADQSNTGFYVPLKLHVKVSTTVVWVNDDNVLHTIQSQDEEGNPSGLFNSNVLNTGERFAFKFDESGTYDYFCTLHPWRVGQVTVT
jgi:plastocyanin